MALKQGRREGLTVPGRHARIRRTWVRGLGRDLPGGKDTIVM